jgi:hypothetical protein
MGMSRREKLSKAIRDGIVAVSQTVPVALMVPEILERVVRVLEAEQQEYARRQKTGVMLVHLVRMQVDDRGLINWVTECGELPPWDGTFDSRKTNCPRCSH